jgi:voltage-gated potassium channel
VPEKEGFERIPPIKPGEEVLRRKRRPRRRLRIAPNVPGFFRFFKDIATKTPFLPILSALIVLWLLFSMGIYFADKGASGTTINSYGDALYCAVAGFSTAGIADMPVTAAGKALCGIWMALGSIIFFGAIVASITAYFMLPRRRPSREIIATIQYNLENLEDLSIEELETLKGTTDNLIEMRMSRLKEASSSGQENSQPKGE